MYTLSYIKAFLVKNLNSIINQITGSTLSTDTNASLSEGEIQNLLAIAKKLMDKSGRRGSNSQLPGRNHGVLTIKLLPHLIFIFDIIAYFKQKFTLLVFLTLKMF